MLDEPAGGINPVFIERLAEMIGALHSFVAAGTPPPSGAGPAWRPPQADRPRRPAVPGPAGPADADRRQGLMVPGGRGSL
jgi:hypothetical protein